jgi:chromosome segregation ATPase
MLSYLRSSVTRVLLVASLLWLFAADPAQAQRRCGQGQSRMQGLSRQSYLQGQPYASQPYLQQLYAQTQPYAGQPYLQQLYAQAQLNALQSNAFMAQINGLAQVNDAQLQLNALQQNALGLQQAGRLTAPQRQSMRQQQTSLSRQVQSTQKAALQDQLDALKEQIQEQQAEGDLTPAELRSLRKQEAALKKQLRALRAQNSN